MSPLYYVITKNTKIVINSKTYFFLLWGNQKNIKITYKKDTRKKEKVYTLYKNPNKIFLAESFATSIISLWLEIRTSWLI